MKTFPVVLIFLILFLTGIADAKTIHVSPTGSNHDQDVINDALKEAASNGGGTVYLENSGTNYVFITNGPIIIPSGNIVLTGDSDIIVRVYSGSDAVQWFTGSNSIITATGQIDNLEIYGFQIDGSCDKLNFEFHHSRSDTDHDSERAIYVQGSSGRFNNNIKIHDMSIVNCFSDGIHVRFANSVHCYSNFISNCQHEGIFWVCVQNGLAEGNRIAGITSDCMRFDNCVSNIIQNNYLFSYTGDQNNQAVKGWNKGIQVADEGASHGYNGSNKPTHTTDIIIRWNTFANCGTQSIWLDSTGKGYDNVHIYDNTFIGVAAVTNDGHDFTLNITETTEGMQNYNNLTENIQPTVEMSERIFESIFDVMYLDFVTQADSNDTIIFPSGVNNTPSKTPWTIEQHTNKENPTTLIYGPTDGLTKVQFKIGGKEETHTLMIGERKGLNVIYTNVSAWSGELSHQGNALYLNGTIDSQDVKVVCYTPKGRFEPSLNVVEIASPKKLFNPILKWGFYIFVICFVYCIFVIKHTY